MSCESIPSALPGSCEAFQWEMSQALDERRPLDPEVQAHLNSCAECAHFARLWSDGSELLEALATQPDAEPAHSPRITAIGINHQVAPREATPVPAWKTLSRWAAMIALAAALWKVLDPGMVHPPASQRPVAAAAPEARFEKPTAAEKEALRLVAVSGVAHARDVLDWSLGVFQ